MHEEVWNNTAIHNKIYFELAVIGLLRIFFMAPLIWKVHTYIPHRRIHKG
jgi:hypothetical protein